MFNDGKILHITLEEYERTGNDFKGTYTDSQGTNPEWNGRKTFMPPLGDESGHYSTCLLIEGASFVIDDEGYDMEEAAREALRDEEDRQYRYDTYVKLVALAGGFDNYSLFNHACDDAMREYVKHYRELDGESFFRPTRAKQIQRMIPYAFEQSHEGSMMKIFYISWAHDWQRTNHAYSLDGEMPGEEESMKKVIAKEYGTSPEAVSVRYEQRQELRQRIND